MLLKTKKPTGAHRMGMKQRNEKKSKHILIKKMYQHHTYVTVINFPVFTSLSPK